MLVAYIWSLPPVLIIHNQLISRVHPRDLVGGERVRRRDTSYSAEILNRAQDDVYSIDWNDVHLMG